MAQQFCIRLLVVALTVAVLAQSTCIDKIRGLVGRGSMGGWRAVVNPQDVAVVRGIVDSCVELYNRNSSDLHQFQQPENGTIEAYVQVVRGKNYCVQFPLVSVHCTKSSYGGITRCSTNELVCSVSAYKPLGERSAPIINKTSLACQTVA